MKHKLIELFRELSETIDYLKGFEPGFDIPKVEGHGDFATNAAMMLAKKTGKNPRLIAEEIKNAIKTPSDFIEKVEIAGPGFLNFFINPLYFSKIIVEIKDKNEKFGYFDFNKGKRANVEFVSANPTGPLTVGHGRNAVCGDTIANILERTGFEVDREYYFNNAGRQMRTLGNSVKLRYLQLLGNEIEFPDDHYQGEYIKDIAQKLIDRYGNSLVDDNSTVFKDTAEESIFEEIKATLLRLGITHSIFFNENTLYEDGSIEDCLNKFEALGLSFKSEGAVWLKLSEMGKEKDKVIVKSTGEPTYRLPDIAYHIKKLERKYDLVIDIFGADHIDTYPDVIASVSALGLEGEKIKVLIHQFVTILQNGEVVKMSTRKANFITLDELIDWVGSDVVRYFFNMRSIQTHMNFDLDLAKKQSDENPVFYLQYAHARICSILRLAEEQSIKAGYTNLHLLNAPEELKLLKKLHQYRDIIHRAATTLDAVVICTYLEELAGLFHRFYTVCRIIGSGKELEEARTALVIAVKFVLKDGLTLLGLTAPERM
ncbi:MAG: arginine--tRNA ligase [Ignavibacteriaceae bacterium]|nr:arginine--tRNA ligase [Ignavibacteriaceae bacterium]